MYTFVVTVVVLLCMTIALGCTSAKKKNNTTNITVIYNCHVLCNYVVNEMYMKVRELCSCH